MVGGVAPGEGSQAAQVAPLNLGHMNLGRLQLGLRRLGLGLGRPEVAEPPVRRTKTGSVRAGGGVVWRRRPDGQVEVLLVHRPKYDDWSLPKGKLERGEDEDEAALREVEEETGLRCVLGPELPTTRYHDRFGRPKSVRYWAMTTEPDHSEFVPNREVDQIRWLSPEDAAALVSYDRDREVVQSVEVGRAP